LFSLAFLWLRDQPALLEEMIRDRMDARIVKVCSLGLNQTHLGKSVKDLQPHFECLKDKFGFNVCGEGGEYESVVFDCPLFGKYRIEIEEQEVVVHEKNAV
jgi:diphthine-ammonia ligase